MGRGGRSTAAWAALAPAVLGAGALAWWLTPGPAAGPPAPPVTLTAPWFEDVTDRVGVDFVHDPGPVGGHFLPQIIGSGVAILDADGDGLPDLVFLQNAGPASSSTHRLFLQQRGGTFADASAGSGLDVAGYGMGVAVGDADGDGRPDLVVSEFGGLRLFLNRGGGRFAEAGPACGLVSRQWATATAFLDFDRDGRLDLVVVHYLGYDPATACRRAGGAADYCHPSTFPGTAARLYRNVTPPGGAVHFEDVTVASGLGRRAGAGLGVACADFDGDGWPDIFVANDAGPNHLWINRRDGTFAEEGVSRGLAFDAVGRPLGNMGVALGPVFGDAGDGLFGLAVTHLTEETPTLWGQGPRGLFRDRTAESGIARGAWRGTGFGVALADFDHDGVADLAMVNGRVSRARARQAGLPRGGGFWDDYAERNQLFSGAGTGRFADRSPSEPGLCGTPAVGRGLAVGDLDGDGALDLVVTAVGGRARVLRNVAPGRADGAGHWLLVRAVTGPLAGTSAVRDALGAEVAVEAGGQRRVGRVAPGQSYLSSHDPRVHFGLASARVVDAVLVRWPDGSAERFAGGPADRVVTVRQGQGVRP